jgi:MYXO-CTERM domain-containing protein
MGTVGAPTPVTGAPAATGYASRSAPLPPDCMTTTSFPGSCTPKVTSCTVDSDCPAAWTCLDVPPTRVMGAPQPGNGVAVGEPAPSGGSSGASAPASIAPGEPDPSGTGTSPAQKICTSPYGGTGVAKDANGNPIETVGGGTTSGSTGSNGTSNPQVPSAGGPGANPPSASGNAAGAPSSGCAVGGANPGSALFVAALALLGLVIARRRR